MELSLLSTRSIIIMEVPMHIVDNMDMQNLIAECTCPVCKGLMNKPQMLRCKHSLCQRCLRRLHRRSISDGSLLCPVCREKSDPSHNAQSDPTTETLLDVLRMLKINLCQEVDCWRTPATCCPSCSTVRCQNHHDSCIQKLRDTCKSICIATETFVTTLSSEAKVHQLCATEESLEILSKELHSKLETRIKECKKQLEQHKVTLDKEKTESKPVLYEIKAKLEELTLLQEVEDFAGMQAAQAQLRQLLASARQRHPPMEVSPPAPLEDCLRSLDGVLARVRVDSVVKPYGAGQTEARLRRTLRTRPLQPWDLALLTNLDGVFLAGDSLCLGNQPGARAPPGPCLLFINFKGFPTKQLYVFDCDGSELVTVKLEMKQGEMPGKFALCNQRQLILASEPSHHCVFAFHLSGALLRRFGRRGSEPGCFNEPMGLFPCHDMLYVVDSENKRVQLFNMDKDFAYVDKLTHPQFTGHVHSVHVGRECIAVSDRERRRLFTFDRLTRQPLFEVPLQGQPFDFASDQYGNLLVSITDARIVRVFNHSLALPLYNLAVPKSRGGAAKAAVMAEVTSGEATAAATSGGAGGGPSSSSSSDDEEPLRRLLAARRNGGSGAGAKRPQIHGLAYLPERRRLFVADTFRCAVLLIDLPV